MPANGRRQAPSQAVLGNYFLDTRAYRWKQIANSAPRLSNEGQQVECHEMLPQLLANLQMGLGEGENDLVFGPDMLRTDPGRDYRL
jgi:hypothetical protein